MNIFKRKYPFEGSTLKDSLLYAVIVFLILYLLKPFGLDRAKSSLLPCIMFGVVTFLAQIIYHFFEVLVSRHVKVWRVWHECISIFCLILFIGICNFLVLCIWLDISVFNFPILLFFLKTTFIVGIFITSIAIFVGYNRSLRTQLASMIVKNADEQTAVMVSIHDTAVRGTDLQLPINDFLFAESVNNDMVIYYRQDGKLQSHTYRMTVAQLLNQLPYDNIMQCHRSFVVNINNVVEAKGNSNGYTLKLDSCSATVPVSRSYVPKLKSFLG